MSIKETLVQPEAAPDLGMELHLGMRVGMVCPYSLDVPGGVQAHVLDLAQHLRALGYYCSVLAPATYDQAQPEYVFPAGKSVGIPYNGSVARLSFSPRSYRRVKKWLSAGNFDILHIHEPNAPSVSMLALMQASIPVVATFHTSTTASLWLKTFQGMLRPYHEKIRGKIVVSELARQWQMVALNSDAVEIPNGIDYERFSQASPLPGYPRSGPTIGFLGRFEEERKGMDILIKAAWDVVAEFPDAEFLVVGHGDTAAVKTKLGALSGHFKFLGGVSDAVKAQALASMDVYCAPQLYGESFGIVLVEAMAAGAAVVASDLLAFKKVLCDGEYGVIVPKGDPAQLARQLIALLRNPERKHSLSVTAREAAKMYDWSYVAADIVKVYEAVLDPARKQYDSAITNYLKPGLL